MNAIIAVIGTDKRGIISGVSTFLSEHNVNILDISQTIMDTYFIMMMLVDLTASDLPLQNLKEGLEQHGQKLGVQVTMQHEAVFQAMHRI